MHESGFPQPLAGKVILDLSTLFPGPYCTSLLAAFGARVIKIEPPGKGDPMRAFTPRMFEELNRNKASVAINLKHDDGKAVLKKMAARADALVEGFRPGVMHRLGVGYESLRKTNPALVYCALSGFGQHGPYRDKAGHDLGFLALGGYYSVPSQIDGVKSRPHVRLADIVAGLFAAQATSMAIWEAQASGEGRLVDVSLFDSVAAIVLPMMFSSPGLATGDVRQMAHVMADSDLFETRDGRYLALTTFEDKLWKGFAAAVAAHSPELAGERFATRKGRDAHKIELSALLKRLFKTRTLAQWRDILDGADSVWCPVYERSELLSDPHFKARGFLAGVHGERSGEALCYSLFPAEFNAARETIRCPAPSLGAHTEPTLRELGFSEADIEDLRRKGIVQQASGGPEPARERPEPC